MRLTVTPIGAQGASLATVAAHVVDYLEGGRGDPGAAILAETGGGAGGYYADSREGPGRWTGAGAAFQRLSGAVEPDAFRRVLEGRHPHTGARLVTAQGSSQRQHLATGTAARFDDHGDALYTIADAARLLQLRHDDVEELIEAGRHGGGDQGDCSWLGSVERDGDVFVGDAEISRHLELAVTPVSGDEVLGGGHRDDELSVSEAAATLRVTPRYVRRICRAYLDDAASEGGGTARLRCRRADDRSTGAYRIRRDDLADFASHRRPPVARVGFDLTLTCAKSLGVLTMLSDGSLQRRLVRALQTANDTAVAHLDRVASVARRGGVSVHTEGLLVASYFHGTSRALDPHPHHHNVVANAVVDDAGEVRTLDARALYRHAPAAAALAAASVRWELRDLGVSWWRRDDGVWEVAGIDEAAIREFSRRRNEMDEVKALLEERLGRRLSHDEENTVAVSTRAAKVAVDPGALRADWQRRADAVGVDLSRCVGRGGEVIAHDVLPRRLVDRLFTDLVDPDHGLCATATTFDQGDVLAAIADWSVVERDGRRRKVLIPPDEVQRLAATFCGSALVAELAGDSVGGVIRRRDGSVVPAGQGEAVFATVELLEVEAEIEHRFTAVTARRAVVDDGLVDEAIATVGDVVLSGEQAALVRQWCTSGRPVQAAIGRAGTGKTTTMRAAARAWEAAGRRVVGCAVKGEAARQLAADAAIEADTVALLLARSAGGQRVLDERTVLIVDEASTIGSRDLLAVLRVADDAGAAVRLIGDPAQHGSVPAGGGFARLVELDPPGCPELREVHRLRNPAERRRAELIRAGRIAEALDELQTSGQLVLADSDAEAYTQMLTRWCDHRGTGAAHPMVHGRNRERRLLNQLAQSILASDGAVDLDQAVTCRDGRRLAVGDDVIARHGDRRVHPTGEPSAWMRNGTTGRIIAIDRGETANQDRITIHTAGGNVHCGRAVFDRRRGGIDLGYAVTSYAVQGSTTGASTSAIGATTARSELYVDVTRGRDSNQLYATRSSTPPEAEHHLPAIDQSTVEALRTRLARGQHRTAHAVDPGALDAVRRRRGRTLAGLLAARRRDIGAGEPVDRAIAQRTAAIKRQAATAPPDALKGVLPPRPTSPHLAARWDDLAGDVAVHVDTNPCPARTRSRSPLEMMLGPKPDPQSDDGAWTLIADRATALAADIVLWQLRRQEPNQPEPGPWARPYLRSLAEKGHLATADITALCTVLTDVTTWRAARRVPGEDLRPLGPPITDNNPESVAERDRLQRRLRSAGRQSAGRSVA